MKLTLQLVVLVLNAQMNFLDSLFKFTLHTNYKIIRKVARRLPWLQNSVLRIVEIGYHQTNEAFQHMTAQSSQNLIRQIE